MFYCIYFIEHVGKIPEESHANGRKVSSEDNIESPQESHNSIEKEDSKKSKGSKKKTDSKKESKKKSKKESKKNKKDKEKDKRNSKLSQGSKRTSGMGYGVSIRTNNLNDLVVYTNALCFCI